MAEMHGWIGRILRVDLTGGRTWEVPTAPYADRFVGGRGIAARIYWEEVPPEVGAFDPENRLIFMTGPLAGTPAPSAARWQVCAKSPMTHPEQYCYGNMGGYWGAELKFAGYDGLILQGRAPEPVYLWIDGPRVELREAKGLWGRMPLEVAGQLREELGPGVKVVSLGPAGERKVRFANLMADDGASATSGFGAVMGSKNLKAVAVRGADRRLPPARPGEFARVRDEISLLTRCSHPWRLPLPGSEYVRQVHCYGCPTGCIRALYRTPSGEEGKGMCQAIFVYQLWDQKYHGRPTEAGFLATRLCDRFGLCTKEIGSMLAWLDSGYRHGLLTEEETGLPLSRIGSLEFFERLVRLISLREGFGDLLAEGTLRAADRLGPPARQLITDYVSQTGFTTTYSPRLYLTTALFYATEPRQPIQQLHEIGTLIQKWVQWVARGEEGSYVSSEVVRAIGRRFWGSELAADFSTYEGKALAGVKIQDRQYAKECLMLCDFTWPLRDSELSPDHVGDPTVESRLFSAVTGMEMDELGLYQVGARVFHLQRAVMLRESRRGRPDDVIEEFNYTIGVQADTLNPDCLVPGPEGKPFSRKGMVLDRSGFERMREEYYALRGWDVETGLPTQKGLEALGLPEVAQELKGRGRLAG